mmetsp:Transcript_63196/g.137432  ORF Transcript_63196/g.137432 Transcript_63196/m.137432 type:complete len:436 (+) Transcript_63196:37-1344(+)
MDDFSEGSSITSSAPSSSASRLEDEAPLSDGSGWCGQPLPSLQAEELAACLQGSGDYDAALDLMMPSEVHAGNRLGCLDLTAASDHLAEPWRKVIKPHSPCEARREAVPDMSAVAEVRARRPPARAATASGSLDRGPRSSLRLGRSGSSASGYAARSDGRPPAPSVNGADDEYVDAGAEVGMAGSASSWHDTLAQFPSLLRLYPLATASEGALGEAGELLNEVVETATDPADRSSDPDAGYCDAPGEAPEEAPGSSVAVASAGAVPTSAARGSGHSGSGPPYCTPTPRQEERATPSMGSARAPADMSDVAAAWAELERERQALALRERAVSQCEAAARRAEARNLAASQQLAELRQRLDEYGKELEEGVITLSLQQDALREERRQAAEMHAQARRLCAAAVREDALASKMAEWDGRPWMSIPTPFHGRHGSGHVF